MMSKDVAMRPDRSHNAERSRIAEIQRLFVAVWSPGGTFLPLASPLATRQTASGLRKALRDSLKVTRHARSLMLITLGTCAMAPADSATVVSGSLGGTSDFVFRGLSL